MPHRRDRSLRAQARAILEQKYAELPAPSAAAPIAAPAFVFDLSKAATQPSLTERARTLYEDSVVPVRDIARLAGVSERTIYKYAHRQNWKPRYRWSAHDLAKWRPGWSGDAEADSAAAGEPHRGWQPEPAFAPAKGAGARFVRREDAGQPLAIGLKANDPAGAALSARSCAAAQAVSASAEHEAAFARELQRNSSACAAATSLLGRALALTAVPEGEGISRREHLRRTRVLDRLLRAAVLVWEQAFEALSATRVNDGRNADGGIDPK